MRRKPWAVYTQAPFAGPRKLLDDLARYTHRVAISNDRLLGCRDGQVRYTYRDRRDGERRKVDAVPPVEFLRRFLQHVLPDGFCRIRHYGLLANCVKRQRLAQCRRSLGVHVPAVVEELPRTAAEWLQRLLGIDITQCPQCGGWPNITPLPSPGVSPSQACQSPGCRAIHPGTPRNEGHATLTCAARRTPSACSPARPLRSLARSNNHFALPARHTPRLPPRRREHGLVTLRFEPLSASTSRLELLLAFLPV